MSDLTVTVVVLTGAIALFIWNQLPAGVVALLVALSLWVTGVLTLDQILAGFGSPTVVLIAALFVVAEGLDAAGITTWAGHLVTRNAGDSRTRLIVLMMIAGAVVAALITPNGAAAALIPMVVVLAIRTSVAPSQLLMPLAFSAHAGSLLMLTGTPINVLVAEAAAEAGARDLRFFEFARVGVPLVLGTIAITVVLGKGLLPSRTAKTLPPDLSRLPGLLQQQYLAAATLARLRIGDGSPFVGKKGVAGVPEVDAITVLAALAADGSPITGRTLVSGDTVIARGEATRLATFASEQRLSRVPADQGLLTQTTGVAEVIISPRSQYLGDVVFPGMVTESGRLIVLAVLRHGDEVPADDQTLRAGDSLLLQGTWADLAEQTRDPEVILVDSPDAIRRQSLALGRRAIPALTILAAMVVMLATGLVPAVIAGLLAAIAMVVCRVVTVPEAHRAISWTTLILVAGMIPLSTAITTTGLADRVGTEIIKAVGGGSPYLLLLGIFLITAIMGQVISNTATALILIPIALAVAAESSLSPLPLLMCVNVASAAALLTPVATPANLMVMGPGSYTFTDYTKFGLPIMVLYLLVGVVLVPLWWPF